MPNTDIEDIARDHVYELRTREYGVDILGPDGHLLGPDGHLLGPILTRLDSAVADLLEYALDISGGIDGTTATYDRLLSLASALPGGPGWHRPMEYVTPSPHRELSFDRVATYPDSTRPEAA